MDFLRLTEFDGGGPCVLCPHPIIERGVVGITESGVATAHETCYIENEAKAAVLDG